MKYRIPVESTCIIMEKMWGSSFELIARDAVIQHKSLGVIMFVYSLTMARKSIENS